MDKKYKTALLMVISYSWWKLFCPRDLVIHYINSAFPSPSSSKRTGFVSGFRETAASQHHHPSRAKARTSKTKPLPHIVLSKENYITDITVTDKSESKTVTKQNFLNVSFTLLLCTVFIFSFLSLVWHNLHEAPCAFLHFHRSLFKAQILFLAQIWTQSFGETNEYSHP